MFALGFATGAAFVYYFPLIKHTFEKTYELVEDTGTAFADAVAGKTEYTSETARRAGDAINKAAAREERVPPTEDIPA